MVSKLSLVDRLKRQSKIRILCFGVLNLGVYSTLWILSEFSFPVFLAVLVASIIFAAVEILIGSSVRTTVNSIRDVGLELKNSGRRLSRVIANIDQSAIGISENVSSTSGAISKIDGSIASMDSLVAENIDRFRSLTHAVSKRTSDAYATMNQLTEAMEALGQTNVQLQDISGVIQKITSETNVINDIVFKTQLLSFNAFLEAARAGQHGTGFAVVAEEVGNLAQSSGDAAKEIRGLLIDSQASVDAILQNTRSRIGDGKGTSEKTLNIFTEIVRHFDEQLKEIIELGRDQKNSVREIESLLKGIRSSSDNAANFTEDYSRLTEALRAESSKLQLVTRRFNDVFSGRQARSSSVGTMRGAETSEVLTEVPIEGSTDFDTNDREAA